MLNAYGTSCNLQLLDPGTSLAFFAFFWQPWRPDQTTTTTNQRQDLEPSDTTDNCVTDATRNIVKTIYQDTCAKVLRPSKKGWIKKTSAWVTCRVNCVWPCIWVKFEMDVGFRLYGTEELTTEHRRLFSLSRLTNNIVWFLCRHSSTETVRAWEKMKIAIEEYSSDRVSSPSCGGQ